MASESKQSSQSKSKWDWLKKLNLKELDALGLLPKDVNYLLGFELVWIRRMRHGSHTFRKKYGFLTLARKEYDLLFKIIKALERDGYKEEDAFRILCLEGIKFLQNEHQKESK